MSSFQVHKFGLSKGGKFFRGHYGHRNNFVGRSQYFWHMLKRFKNQKSMNIKGHENSNPVIRHEHMGEVKESTGKRKGSSTLVQSAYRRNYDMN
jgi:hypothetical protein